MSLTNSIEYRVSALEGGQHQILEGQRSLGIEAMAFFLYGLPNNLMMVLAAFVAWHAFLWWIRKYGTTSVNFWLSYDLCPLVSLSGTCFPIGPLTCLPGSF